MIATGSQALTLQDFPIPEAAKNRVLYEILPVLGVAGKHFAIVGAGDLAFDYALNLGKRNTVTILNRGSETRCVPLWRERAGANPKISIGKIPGSKACARRRWASWSLPAAARRGDYHHLRYPGGGDPGASRSSIFYQKTS